MKFKIGEFSNLCQVTVKTLRHYEEIAELFEDGKEYPDPIRSCSTFVPTSSARRCNA